MSSSSGPGLSVGLLYDGSVSDEQFAYRDCLERLGHTVEFVSLRESEPDLSAYDVLAWHRGRPLDDVSALPEATLRRVYGFVADGGGLFLSLFALDAVERLGIDDRAPDATPGEATAESGLLRKPLFSEHPVFADIECTRIPTQPGRSDAVGTCYRRYLPADGTVLASRVRNGEDVPREKSLFEWRAGDGVVLGLGTDCRVENVPEPYAERLETVFDGVVDHLAAPVDSDEAAYPTDREDFETMRSHLSTDHHRPSYHLVPPANWINDPNGLIKWDDEYHVFYQYNPAGPFHDTIHWGHAVSEDLVTWRDEPLALSPEPDEPDEDGCWSGCAVDDGGTPTLLYTGGSGRDQRPCIATSDGDLREWTTHDGNPIITDPPEEPPVLETEHWSAEFRDHCVWREDGTWYQLIGSGVEGVGGTALLYESDHLYEWEYRGPILTGDWPGAGPVWECPELLHFDERSLLHVSNYNHVRYFLGQYDDGTFEPEAQSKLDYGDFYAPQSLDDGDRTLTWGWVEEARSGRDQWDAGWSGMLSLPRELSVDADGDLRVEPAAELEALRRNHHSVESLTLTPESPNPLADVQSRSCEIRLEVDVGDAWEVGLAVFQSPDGEEPEQTLVRYTGETVVVEREESVRSGADSEAETHEQVMPVQPRADGTVELRCFLDGSVIELFANGRRCLTSRVYPASERSRNLELFALGGDVYVSELDVWELDDGHGVSPERLKQQIR